MSRRLGPFPFLAALHTVRICLGDRHRQYSASCQAHADQSRSRRRGERLSVQDHAARKLHAREQSGGAPRHSGHPHPIQRRGRRPRCFNVKCTASQATIFLACITDDGGGYTGITIRNGSVTVTASAPTDFGDQVTGLNLESSSGVLTESIHLDGQQLTNYAANAIISGVDSIVRSNTFVNAGPTFSCPSLVEGNVNQIPSQVAWGPAARK